MFLFKLSPPQVVLVLVVHQAFRANNLSQSGGQEAIVSVNDRQPLVVQLYTETKSENTESVLVEEELTGELLLWHHMTSP